MTQRKGRAPPSPYHIIPSRDTVWLGWGVLGWGPGEGEVEVRDRGWGVSGKGGS